MPRDGALTLSDVRRRTVDFVCGACDRRGSYPVSKLIERYGNETLPDLLNQIVDCPRAHSLSYPKSCRAMFEKLVV